MDDTVESGMAVDWTTRKGWSEGIAALLHRPDGKIERLAELDLFDGCSRKSLAAAARLMDFVPVQAGTVLAREGQVAAQVVVVASGRVSVSRKGRSAGAGAKGDVFGEIAALGHLPHSETVVARDHTEVAVIGAREFRRLLDSLPCLALKVLERAATSQRVA